MNIAIPAVGRTSITYRSRKGTDIRIDKRLTINRKGIHIAVEHHTFPTFGKQMTCTILTANEGRMVVALEWCGACSDLPPWHDFDPTADRATRRRQREESLWNCLVTMYEHHGDCHLMLMEANYPNRNMKLDLAEEMESNWLCPDAVVRRINGQYLLFRPGTEPLERLEAV
jgi:hypothetical protein